MRGYLCFFTTSDAPLVLIRAVLKRVRYQITV